MKIEKLRQEAVRSARKVDGVVHLSTEELRKVIHGGDGGDGRGNDIDPETCAIHFYYPSDLTE